MKSFLLLCALACIGFASCSDDKTVEPEPEQEIPAGNYAFRSKFGLGVSRGYIQLEGKDQAGIISEDKSSFKPLGIKQVRVLIQGDDGQGFSVKYENTQLSGTGTITASLSVIGYYDKLKSENLYKATAEFTRENPVAYFPRIDKTFEVGDFEFIRVVVGTYNPYYDYPERLNGYIEIWGDYPNLEVTYPDKFPIAKNPA